MAMAIRPGRALLPLLAACAVPSPTRADVLQVVGNAGVLGEWELTATITGAPSKQTREMSGHLTMRHVGLCTQDGPEEKTGFIRVRAYGASARVEGTLVTDGVECAFTATADDAAPGTLMCPDRRAVPLSLSIK
jgi:hypothetical protein